MQTDEHIIFSFLLFFIISVRIHNKWLLSSVCDKEFSWKYYKLGTL